MDGDGSDGERKCTDEATKVASRMVVKATVVASGPGGQSAREKRPGSLLAAGRSLKMF